MRPAKRATLRPELKDLPIFLAHGLFPIESIPSAKLGSATAGSLPIVDRGDAVVAGWQCRVFDLQPAGAATPIRVSVDPERQSAVLRIETFFNDSIGGQPILVGVVAIQTDIEYEERSGLWVPVAWQNVWNEPSDAVDGAENWNPRLTLVMTVARSALNTSPAEAVFEPPIAAGLGVDREDGRYYRVAADGKTVEEIAPPPVPRNPVPRNPVPRNPVPQQPVPQGEPREPGSQRTL